MHELRTVFVCRIDQLFPEDRRHVAHVSVAIDLCMIPLNHSELQQFYIGMQIYTDLYSYQCYIIDVSGCMTDCEYQIGKPPCRCAGQHRASH